MLWVIGAGVAQAQNPVARKLAPSDFKLQAWAKSPFTQGARPGTPGAGLDLAMAVAQSATEEITVYARRPARPVPDTWADAPSFHVGRAEVTGGALDFGGFHGAGAQVSIPILGIPGLALVFNAGAGHDQINESTTRRAAVATIGLVMKF